MTCTARVGREALLRVTITSIDVPLAFGADRALLGWMQIRAYLNGFVASDTLSEYFRDFGLGASGREYLQAWDLAAFVLYRTDVAESPAVIPWAEPVAQLGSADRYPYRLRAALNRVLEEIRGGYPGFPGQRMCNGKPPEKQLEIKCGACSEYRNRRTSKQGCPCRIWASR